MQDAASTYNTRGSSNAKSFQRKHSNLKVGLNCEQVRKIIFESFQLFRNIELNPDQVKELEDVVFSGSVVLSPRSAAKAIL